MNNQRKYLSAVFAVLVLTGSAAAQSVEVPFEFIHNEIVVKVSINGKGPLNAMIDTGTDPSAIDITTAREVGVELGTKAYRASGGGTDLNRTYACKLSSLMVGDISASNVDAAAINLAKVSERMGVKIDAVLGHSFLKKRIVQFDYPHLIVRFLDKRPVPGTDQATVTMPFRYKDNVLIDGITVNGKPVTANLDTGSSGMIELSPKATEYLGLSEDAARGRSKVSVGYNGEHETREGTIKNIKLGSISADDVPATFLSKGTGHDQVPWSINIGNGFLKNYVVTVDYVAKTVVFSGY